MGKSQNFPTYNIINRHVKQRTTIHLRLFKLRQRLMNKEGSRWQNKGVIQKKKLFYAEKTTRKCWIIVHSRQEFCGIQRHKI